MINEVCEFDNNSNLITDFEFIYSNRRYWEYLNDQSILITGAYGSIARYLSYFLIWLKKEKQININLFFNGRNKNKFDKYFGKYYDFFTPLIEDISVSSNTLPVSIDMVFYAASPARPDLFKKYPVETILPNVVGLNNLLARYKNAKFLYFSSASVYGENSSIILDETIVGKINYFDTMSSYAESKRVGELLCRSYFEEYNVNTKIIRISHTFGPTLNFNEDTRAFSIFIKTALENNEIIINSDGNAKRAFLYISDAIIGIFDVLFKGVSGEAYNIGGNNFISIKDFANMISTICDCNLEILNKAVVQDKNSNHEQPPSNLKLEKLGWNQSVDVKAGIEKTINILKFNKKDERYE